MLKSDEESAPWFVDWLVRAVGSVGWLGLSFGWLGWLVARQGPSSTDPHSGRPHGERGRAPEVTDARSADGLAE